VADELQSGDVVTKAVFGDDSEPETYSLLMAPGKLIRNTRQHLDLADADGDEFEWFEFPVQEPPPPPPDGDPPPPPPFDPPTHWRVVYDHGAGTFYKTATFDDPDCSSRKAGSASTNSYSPESDLSVE